MDAVGLPTWIDYAVEVFGTDRCFFASNFPVDSTHGTFDDLYSTFDDAHGRPRPRRPRKLFATNAERVYRCCSTHVHRAGRDSGASRDSFRRSIPTWCTRSTKPSAPGAWWSTRGLTVDLAHDERFTDYLTDPFTRVHRRGTPSLTTARW